MHSTVTQKQSIDSMTLSRCQSFKVQGTNQFKLKSNFRSNSSNTVIHCQQQPNIDVSIDHHIDNTSNGKNESIGSKKNRSAPPLQPPPPASSTSSCEQQTCYDVTEINSNALHYVKGSMTPNDARTETTEMLSMAPSNIEINTKKIRLNMAPIQTQPIYARRTKRQCYSKLRRSTTQPILRPWFGWFRPTTKKNAAFYSPPMEHPTNGMKIQIHINENPNGNAAVTTALCVDTTSSNDDEEISNSSLQNVDQMALKDELAAYMDEIRAREKR